MWPHSLPLSLRRAGQRCQAAEKHDIPVAISSGTNSSSAGKHYTVHRSAPKVTKVGFLTWKGLESNSMGPCRGLASETQNVCD